MKMKMQTLDICSSWWLFCMCIFLFHSILPHTYVWIELFCEVSHFYCSHNIVYNIHTHTHTILVSTWHIPCKYRIPHIRLILSVCCGLQCVLLLLCTGQNKCTPMDYIRSPSLLSISLALFLVPCLSSSVSRWLYSIKLQDNEPTK